MTRPLAEFDEVDRLIRWGMNDCAIARLTGISRTTIGDWRRKGPAPMARSAVARAECPICGDAALDASSYAYLLGVYLGDSCLGQQPRGVFKLRITLDLRYLSIIEECSRAIAAVRSGGKMQVGFVEALGCLEVTAYWKHWPCLFPQHARGPKHLRKIELQPWRSRLLRRFRTFCCGD